MYFEEFGERSERAVVFLHGWGGSVDSFRPVISLLPQNDYIISLDFAGFGKSKEPSKAYTVSDYATDLKNLLDFLGVKEATFVCHSFGGRVAIKFIALFPNVAQRVVFVDSAGIKPKKTIRQKFAIFRYKIVKKLVVCGLIKSSVLNKYGSEDYKVLSPVMKQTFNYVVNEDLTKYLSLIKIPTLIVWGENDKDTPLYMAHKFEKEIKNSKLIVYKDAGHFCYLDNLEDFVYILYKFLKE